VGVKAGRPSVITEDILRKLEEAFSVGATDIEACFLANISKTTLYDYQKKNSEFTERKEALKDMLKYQARVNVSKEINKGNLEASRWYLERKAKEEFSSRQDLNHGMTEEVRTLFTEEQIRTIAKRIIARSVENI
jgi:hypothetical protein